MANLVTDDIEWVSNEIIVEAKGKSNLVESMDTYFKSCATCRSKLSDLVSTTNRVCAVEIASWQGKVIPLIFQLKTYCN